MSDLISLVDVPDMPADPEAIASAASTLRSNSQTVGERTQTVATDWSSIGTVYDTPDTIELASKITVVQDAGTDFSDAFGAAATALDDLAASLAAAKTTLDTVREEVPQLRSQVRAYRDDQEELYEVENSTAWGPGQNEWNSRLWGDALSAQSAIDQAVEDCEAALRRIEGVPQRAESALVGTDLPVYTGSALDQQQQFESAIGLAILARLSANGGADASSLLEDNPDWLTLVQDYPPPPDDVRAWWTGLDPVAVAALLAGVPILVGNLDGVRLADRFTANQTNVQNGIDDALAEIERLEAAKAAMIDADSWGDAMTIGEYNELLELHRARVDAWQALLNSTSTTFDEAGVPHTTGPNIAVFDPDRDAIATYHGPIDPETGDIPSWIENVVVSVPGTGANTSNWSDARGGDIYNGDPNHRTAVFQWAGGTFPQSIPEAMDSSYSHALAPRLVSFTSGIPTPPGADVTVLGHSYGGATVGVAEAQGLEADKVLYMAAAGLGEGNDSLEDFPHTSDVPHYAIMARNDLVVGPIQGEWTDWMHGSSTLSVSGVTRLESGQIDAGSGDSDWIEGYNVPGNGTPPAIDAHSAIFNPSSDAFANMMAVITGGEAQVYAPDATENILGLPYTVYGYQADGYSPDYVTIE